MYCLFNDDFMNFLITLRHGLLVMNWEVYGKKKQLFQILILYSKICP
jgi:hypothetical protein